ncbi:MAG: PTS transporter subunit EIIC [Clostridia bacterium]|nr:PTS transporter subunit EIIC [Clostridia bacterium]
MSEKNLSTKALGRNSCFSILQRVGQSFMFPIALLPIAGLLLGIGASFSNEKMIASYGLEWLLGSGTFLNFVLVVMKNTGDVIFGNLPIIFAIGVAIGMANKEKAVAALSAAITFLSMHTVISSLLALTGKLIPGALLEGSLKSTCGIKSLDMGVFGGIIVGLGVAALHNKFYKIKLPVMLSFFGGIRFVPIISVIVYIFVGVLMFFVWPYVQGGMYSLGNLVTASKYAGTFVFGVIERALIPFGLHHVFYTPFWQTGLGGSQFIDGSYVTGAQNIFFAQLASPNTTKFSVEAAKFLQGKFPFMIFGLPGAALAMYTTAKSSKKKLVSGLLFSAALTSIVTGITEPIEFTFLFVAPVLYGVHCVLAGLSHMLLHMFNVAVGSTFSCGLIDLVLFGILPGNEKTNWIYIIPVGIAYFVIYYFLFKFAIVKFNLKTPGREEDEVDPKLYTKKDFNGAKENSTSEMILAGLGGVENIEHLDCCATRLRVKLHDISKIDENLLKESGCAGVIKKSGSVQVIYGPRVTVIKAELEEYIAALEKSK